MTTDDLIKLNGEKHTPIIAERLNLIRRARGYKSQKAAASALGFSGTAYCQYELGRRTPGLDVLIKIAKTFNCSIDWLAGLSEEVERR